MEGPHRLDRSSVGDRDPDAGVQAAVFAHAVQPLPRRT